ncbi:hypothetical protein [Clavibacter tessellarius]|uniref:hypothetical protein n=1 Tax=Clavibacter tessellarius TaxID=31965 RepID=UPI0032443AD3
MDSGLAVIVGAAIALVSSSLIPWLREAVTQRSEREREYRLELREAARAAIDSISEAYLLEGEDAASPERAISRKARIVNLGIVVRGEDAPLSVAVEDAAGLISMPDQLGRYAGYRAITEIVPKWFRGGCTSAELMDEYRTMCDKWYGLADAAVKAGVPGFVLPETETPEEQPEAT